MKNCCLRNRKQVRRTRCNLFLLLDAMFLYNLQVSVSGQKTMSSLIRRDKGESRKGKESESHTGGLENKMLSFREILRPSERKY